MTLTITEDRYLTRMTSAVEPVDRAEPTVWSDRCGGPIDPATLAAHDGKGYSVHDDLLSPAEVQAYRQELERLAADERVLADERAVLAKGTDEIRTVYEVHKLSPLIAELVRDPRVLDRAEQLLGSAVYVHQSQVSYRPGFTGEGSYWHADFETWHAEDGMPLPRAVRVSIALTDNYPFAGGPMVIPGSHRTFVPCSTSGPDRECLTTFAVNHGIDQFTGPAGTALICDANVMHGAANNITPFPSLTISVVFNSVHNTLVEPFAGTEPRPSFLASRDFDPLYR